METGLDVWPVRDALLGLDALPGLDDLPRQGVLLVPYVLPGPDAETGWGQIGQAGQGPGDIPWTHTDVVTVDQTHVSHPQAKRTLSRATSWALVGSRLRDGRGRPAPFVDETASAHGNAESPLAVSGGFNAQVVDWAQMRDCWFDVDRVPELLERVERRGDAEAWTELGWRLVLEHDLVSPASFAALPRLVRLAPHSAEARGLAGKILERAAGRHGSDDLLADCASAIAEFREVLDRHLRSRPADYLVSFRALLATEEEYHWANALEGFTDDINHVDCPHCAAGVMIVIGVWGCYSQVWEEGEGIRRDLRPVAAEELTGTGRWMYRITVRDGQVVLANGITYLFGKAECPRCGSVFNVADEYTSANRPVLR
ncbi:hypothetical protein ACFQ6B_03180 [Streptomyces wedmorensis]|uniref:DUF1963 domain-containing protein n=1 Tax=Streptomyces wedmorensis TaxID=43759 RepID=A0ABW6J3R5_STRWE